MKEASVISEVYGPVLRQIHDFYRTFIFVMTQAEDLTANASKYFPDTDESTPEGFMRWTRFVLVALGISTSISMSNPYSFIGWLHTFSLGSKWGHIYNLMSFLTIHVLTLVTAVHLLMLGPMVLVGLAFRLLFGKTAPKPMVRASITLYAAYILTISCVSWITGLVVIVFVRLGYTPSDPSDILPMIFLGPSCFFLLSFGFYYLPRIIARSYDIALWKAVCMVLFSPSLLFMFYFFYFMGIFMGILLYLYGYIARVSLFAIPIFWPSLIQQIRSRKASYGTRYIFIQPPGMNRPIFMDKRDKIVLYIGGSIYFIFLIISLLNELQK